MHVERLRRLEALLRADAVNATGAKFDLGTWVAPATSVDRVFEGESTPEAVPVNCNTSACAMGLAVLSGAFEADGLCAYYQPVYGQAGKTRGFQLIPAMKVADVDDYQERGFGAAEQLFDISENDAVYLFDPGRYIVTKGAEAEIDVADRIRDFCEGHIDRDAHPDTAREDNEYDDDDDDEDDSED